MFDPTSRYYKQPTLQAVDHRGRTVTFDGGFADHNLHDLSYFTDKHNKYATREAIEVLNQRLGLFARDEALNAHSASFQASFKRRVKERLYNRIPFTPRGMSPDELQRSCLAARRTFYGGPVRNLDLAEHLLERLRVHGWDEARDPDVGVISAEELRAGLTARIARRSPAMEIEVVLDERATAKVVAGMSRVRIRPDATFTACEAEGLWHHEIETHALTAHNGAAQVNAPFLRSGGPRTTRTQEGLAVFSELYNKTLSVQRLQRLAVRVKLVDMAEQGATFIDLHRHLVAAGATPRDAYFDAQRICRGGLCGGGAPFTKDACYCKGIVLNFAFLRAAIQLDRAELIPFLFVGKVAHEDIPVLYAHVTDGIVKPPPFLPPIFEDMNGLAIWMCYASFFSRLGGTTIADHYAKILGR
mgnify:CR=1 FL=1